MPRNRKPNALKVLAGTDRPDRHREEAQFPKPDSFEPPDFLTGPIAVQIWRDLVELLDGAGVLDAADVRMLAHFCNWDAALVQKWDAGMMPNAAEITQLRLLAADFGLAPAHKSKVGAKKKGDKNPFSEFEIA